MQASGQARRQVGVRQRGVVFEIDRPGQSAAVGVEQHLLQDVAAERARGILGERHCPSLIVLAVMARRIDRDARRIECSRRRDRQRRRRGNATKHLGRVIHRHQVGGRRIDGAARDDQGLTRRLHRAETAAVTFEELAVGSQAARTGPAHVQSPLITHPQIADAEAIGAGADHCDVERRGFGLLNQDRATAADAVTPSRVGGPERDRHVVGQEGAVGRGPEDLDAGVADIGGIDGEGAARGEVGALDDRDAVPLDLGHLGDARYEVDQLAPGGEADRGSRVNQGADAGVGRACCSRSRRTSRPGRGWSG